MGGGGGCKLLIGGLCVWLSASAVRTLGKQWTYVARTIEGHELITQGPYRLGAQSDLSRDVWDDGGDRDCR